MKKLFMCLLVVGFALTSCDEMVEAEMDKIENQVAKDAEEQYRIAKESGSAMDAYVQAGFVAAAYLQAKDEVNYKKWKEIEKKEGELAGAPSEEDMKKMQEDAAAMQKEAEAMQE
jgi:protein involved in sex pheromone biosynthesis